MVNIPRTIRVEAVVLRHKDWGEADRLLWLYSRQRGKLRAVAKGARRLRSRKAGHLEPFTRVALLLARGRDLWIVTQAETIDAYLPLREDLVLTGYAAYVLELVDRFIYDDEQIPSLYRLLVNTLNRLSKEANTFKAVRYYEIRLLDLLGFRPELFQCVQCREEIQAQDQFFSAAQGGVLCPRCGKKAASTARPVSMQALKFLRHFQRSSYAEACRARPSNEVKKETETLLQYYLTYLLERKLNTPEFLRHVQKGQK